MSAAVILVALLFTGCCGWERPDVSGVAGTGGGAVATAGNYRRVVEFTNTTGLSIDCDWTGDNQRQPLTTSTSTLSFNNQQDGADGPVADGAASRSNGIVLTWLDANRQPVVSIPALRHVLNNGTLQFPPYRGDLYRPDVHSAEYRCLASSSSGALLSPPILIRSAVIGALQVYASDAYTLPGNAVVLPCLVLPSDQAWAIEVTHWTAGSTHLVDSHLIPQPGSKYAVIDGHLHVGDVTAEDTRLAYRCFARHRLNGQQQRPVSSPPAKIIFSHQQPLPMAPQLVPDGVHRPSSTLRIRHARLGQDEVYMSCTVVAYPPAKIRWFKINAGNGAALAMATDGRRIVTSGDWLRIDRVSLEDGGRYRCQATNSQGQMETEFRLDTHGPLRVRLEPQRQIVGINQPVELTCNVSGLIAGQTPSIRWMRNGQDIGLDVGRFYLPQPNVLRINQAGLTDSGMYQCFVRIETGTPSQASSQAQASAELLVRDFPSRLNGVFNEQTVHPGRPVYLQCLASGIPVPSIVWTVDSFTLPYTSGRVSTWSHQVDENGMRSYLNISSVEVEDGGLYCCSVQSQSSSAQLDHEPKSSMQHCARLNVYGIASIRWAGNKTAVANQDYHLHCPFAGYPILSITWHRGGQIIRETDKYKTFNNGTLRISATDPAADSGEYTCQVKGSASSMARKALYVEVIRPPVIEPFGFPNQVQDGGRAQVTCSISSGDLPIQVSWMRDGHPISSHLNVEMQTGEFHSLLIFKRLRGEHSGVYTCTARNMAAAASHSATLLVQVPPRWIVEPQDVSLLENYPATIPCEVHGMPAPNLRWFRIEGENNAPVHSTNKISLSGDGSLRFSRTTKNDEGLFQCRASNGIGNPLSKTIRVSVNAAAKVRIHANGAILPTGSEAVLRCEATGDPPLTVHWRRLDQLVDQMDRFQLIMTPAGVAGQSQFLDLNISRVEAEDGGVYICQAANAYGSDASDIRLIVQELPKAPGQLQLTSVQSRSAELQWLDDDVDPLLEYCVQLTRPNTGWTYNHTIEAGRNIITLPNLHPSTTYHVQVNAVNSAGVGPPSALVEFQTHEEAPSGSVRHVQAEPKSSRSAIVSWLPPNEETWNGRLVTFTVTCLENGSGQVIQRSVAYPVDSSRAVRRVHVTVDELRPATGYTITVRPLNRMGIGPESEAVSFTTPEAAPSSAPANLQCVSLSADAIQVTWAHPAPAHHHGHLQGFRIFYKIVPVAGKHTFMAEDVSAFRPESKKVGNVLDTVLYGLQAFHNYSIQISALNRAGNGPLSVPIVCQTDEKGPSPVQEMKAVSLSGTWILLTWRKPTPHSGRIAHYIIQMKDTITQETKKFVQHDGDILDYQVGQLVENRLYEISITAKGRMGESRPSRTVTVAPVSKSGAKILEFSRTIFMKEEHGEVILTCPAAGNLPIEKSWTFGGQSLTAYPHLNYRWGKDGALHLLEVDKNSEGEYSCTARNQHGRDAVVYTLHLLRTPEMPQLSVTPTSTSSIRLWWNKPSSANSGRLPVQDYTVFYRPAYSGTAVQEKIVDGSVDGTILDGLLCGTQYELQVQARNYIGTGPKSPILRAMTRGSGPTLPELSDLFGFSAGMPATLFLHLDHWPTGGCRISSIQVEKRGPISLTGSDASGWNALASNLNPDEQPILKINDFIYDEMYHLRLTAASDAGIQTVTYNMRRISRRKAENGSSFEVVPMMSTAGQPISYESLIVIASMSISGMMLLFSLVAISYVIHKRKQYQANAAAAAASTKSEYSLRTVAEQLDTDNHPFNHGRSLPRSNGVVGSNYSLRKQVQTTPVDYADDDDITPYATFTLKPISGMDTTRSLMSVPSGRGADSYSSNSIEADVYGHHGQHPTLPCMTMQPPPPPIAHPAHVYRHLNRSPVPPYRPSSDATTDSLYGETVYTNSTTSKTHFPSGSIGRPRNQHRSNHSRTTTADVVTRPGRPLSEFYRHDDDVNKFRF